MCDDIWGYACVVKAIKNYSDVVQKTSQNDEKADHWTRIFYKSEKQHSFPALKSKVSERSKFASNFVRGSVVNLMLTFGRYEIE